MNDLIKDFLIKKGADIVRFADISALPVRQTQGFKYAVVFCLALTKKFILDMHNNLPVEKDEFLEKEHRADEIADQLAEYIREKGYQAYSQSEKSNSENGNYVDETLTSILPNKTVARLAGLGFMGKNDLLITKEYGCGFSMCTVLTDAPIFIDKITPIASKCGTCNACVKACPANAVSGFEWTENGGRESLVDVSKCFCELKCVTACPWTLRYAKQ